MRFYPRPYRRDEVRAMIDRNPARYAAYGFGLWAVEERSGGGFLGDCGLTIQLVEGIAEVEIAWHVARTRWREGIATEAATAVRDHAFGDPGLRRLIALGPAGERGVAGGWPGSSGWRSNLRECSTTFPI
jgi:RimJ/RimL family protein N-acetyltransferase